jgi:hypothetical protein
LREQRHRSFVLNPDINNQGIVGVKRSDGLVRGLNEVLSKGEAKLEGVNTGNREMFSNVKEDTSRARSLEKYPSPTVTLEDHILRRDVVGLSRGDRRRTDRFAGDSRGRNRDRGARGNPSRSSGTRTGHANKIGSEIGVAHVIIGGSSARNGGGPEVKEQSHGRLDAVTRDPRAAQLGVIGFARNPGHQINKI